MICTPAEAFDASIDKCYRLKEIDSEKRSEIEIDCKKELVKLVIWLKVRNFITMVVWWKSERRSMRLLGRVRETMKDTFSMGSSICIESGSSHVMISHVMEKGTHHGPNSWSKPFILLVSMYRMLTNKIKFIRNWEIQSLDRLTVSLQTVFWWTISSPNPLPPKPQNCLKWVSYDS